MTLIVPSGDSTGVTDLAHINAMGPNDELAVGTFYINGPITAMVIRGVDQAHWEYLSPAALTLIVTFDESATDNTNGGGKIYWVAVGPKVKSAYQSTALYQHQSTLRESLEALGLTHDLGDAATAPSMAEFFR